MSILPLHDSCFPNSHCSVFTWKSSSDCSLSCCWACATADVRCVLSSAAAAWGRDALDYQISWCVAGGEHFCALQLQWISWCGNFIRLVELIRPPPEVWEWSGLGPVLPLTVSSPYYEEPGYTTVRNFCSVCFSELCYAKCSVEIKSSFTEDVKCQLWIGCKLWDYAEDKSTHHK